MLYGSSSVLSQAEEGSSGDATTVVGSGESTTRGCGKSLGQILRGFGGDGPKTKISWKCSSQREKLLTLQLPSQESPAITLVLNWK